MQRKSHRTGKAHRPALIWAVVFSLILALNLTGCAPAGTVDSTAADSAPFYSDRVATVRLVMSEANWETTLLNAQAEEYVKADLWFDDLEIQDVAVRPKGNSSLMSVAKSGSARLSLKVDLNFFNDARSLYGVKKLNFNNGFSDPSLIREALSYDLFNEMGIPTPRFSFVDLWVNDTHLGVYTMVEQVDKTFLSGHFTGSNGNLYKPESPGGTLKWTAADLNTQAASTQEEIVPDDINIGGARLGDIEKSLENEYPETVPEALPADQAQFGPGAEWAGGRPDLRGLTGRQDYLTSMGLKTNENNSDHTALLRFLEVLNLEPEETFATEIEKVLDVDETLRYIAVSTVLVHLDNYVGQFAHNYYLYEDDGYFTILPWDLNMSFGGFANQMTRDQVINFYIDEPTSGLSSERPLVSRLLAVPEYLERYHTYLEEIIEGPFSAAVMESKINTLADLIRPYVEADDLKFFSTAEFEAALGSGSDSTARVPGSGGNYGLLSFVVERDASIAAQLEGTLSSRSADGSGNVGGTLPGGANQPGAAPDPAGRQNPREGFNPQNPRNQRPGFIPGEVVP